MSDLRPAVTNVVVVIPAHNEVADLPRCIQVMRIASACLPIPVLTVVVLDACNDMSERLAGQFGADVQFLRINSGNVGMARAAGFAYARAICDDDVSRTWYATSDADTQVDPDWLLRQVATDADMVLGVVRVPVWWHHPKAVADRYLRDYHRSGTDHDHIHGANLGVRADAYWCVGGFAPLATGEDVDLVARIDDAGFRICRDGQLSVATSDRRIGRAPGGFAAHLQQVSCAVLNQIAGEPA